MQRQTVVHINNKWRSNAAQNMLIKYKKVYEMIVKKRKEMVIGVKENYYVYENWKRRSVYIQVIRKYYK